MKNGCPECEKLGSGDTLDDLCDICILGYLEATMEAAIHDYTDKVNEILKKESEASNAKCK